MVSKNKIFNLYTLIIAIAIFLLTTNSFAEPILNSTNTLLKLSGGEIYYKNTTDEEGTGVPIFFKNYGDNSTYFIDEIYYFGTKGEVGDVFILSEQGEDVLYIILKTPLNFNSTGIPYASDLFSIYRYIKNEGFFVPDESKLKGFFGEGADIGTISDEGEILRGKDAIKYVFPYKNKSSIINAIDNDELYHIWSKYNNITLLVDKDTVLQEFPNYIESEKKTIKKGTKATLKDVSGSWLLIEYKNNKNLVETGWILKNKAEVFSYN